jgi:hypothetical protein
MKIQKNEKWSKQEFGLTQQKQSLSLFKTERSRNPIWSSRVITTKKVTKEVLEVSGLTKVLWRKHQQRHYIYRYWFWWTLHFGPAKTKLEQKINAEKSAIASKLKSVETSDSMTSNQIIAKYDQNYNIGIR